MAHISVAHAGVSVSSFQMLERQKPLYPFRPESSIGSVRPCPLHTIVYGHLVKGSLARAQWPLAPVAASASRTCSLYLAFPLNPATAVLDLTWWTFGASGLIQIGQVSLLQMTASQSKQT